MRTNNYQIALSPGIMRRPASPFFILLLVICFAGQAFPSDRKSDDSSKSGNESEKSKTEAKSEMKNLGEIKNFGKVGDHLFRGAQPNPEDYAALAKAGIKTVVDLRDDPRGFAKESASRAGLQYISFPLSDHDYPAAGSAEKFLSIVGNGENWPIYIHCAGGRHRTGIMTAVYRMTVEGWDIERAYREMKQYDFYTRWGHQVMKDFIYDYSAQLDEKRGSQLASSKAVSPTPVTAVAPVSTTPEAAESGKPE